MSKSQAGTSVWTPDTYSSARPKTAPRTSVGCPAPGAPGMQGRVRGSVLSWPGVVGTAGGVAVGDGAWVERVPGSAVGAMQRFDTVVRDHHPDAR